MTMAIPVGMKRRLQNIPQFFRENRDERLAEKRQEADSRRERMTVSDRIDMNRDWTGRSTRTGNMIRVEAVRVHRKREPIFTADGIRTRVGYGIVIVMLCVLVTVLLVDLGGIGYTNRQIQRAENKIENFQRDSERTAGQLAEVKGNTQLISQAVQLNMVSSGSGVIVLRAPTNANLSFEAEQNVTVGSESLALIQGD